MLRDYYRRLARETAAEKKGAGTAPKPAVKPAGDAPKTPSAPKKKGATEGR